MMKLRPLPSLAKKVCDCQAVRKQLCHFLAIKLEVTTRKSGTTKDRPVTAPSALSLDERDKVARDERVVQAYYVYKLYSFIQT